MTWTTDKPTTAGWYWLRHAVFRGKTGAWHEVHPIIVELGQNGNAPMMIRQHHQGGPVHHRYSARKRVTCAVTLSCDGLVGQGHVLDLSVPGCLLETGLPLKHGQCLQVERLPTFHSGHVPTR